VSFHLAAGFKIHREGDKTQRQCLNRIYVLSSAGAYNVGTVKRPPHLPGILKPKTLGCNAPSNVGQGRGKTAGERKHQVKRRYNRNLLSISIQPELEAAVVCLGT
jgi:hypothetical protein